MKKFAMFLMALSVGMFTLGCQPSTPAKKTDEKKAGADVGKDKPADTPAEKPAEPAK